MILYHGSNITVEKPHLGLSRRNLDFGIGFYTTVNKDQAITFSQKVGSRKNPKTPIVSVYNFDIDAAESLLNKLSFLKYSHSFNPGEAS